MSMQKLMKLSQFCSLWLQLLTGEKLIENNTFAKKKEIINRDGNGHILPTTLYKNSVTNMHSRKF